MKKIFIHDIDILDLEILVCVGVKSKDVIKWADKNSKIVKKLFTKELSEKFDEFSKMAGFVHEIEENNKKSYILFLKDFKDCWDQINVLNHEIVHLKQYQFESKCIKNEMEFEAYFQETTFNLLRRKLTKMIKK